MANQTEIDKGDSFQRQKAEEDIFKASEEFKEDAHFSSFNQYKNEGGSRGRCRKKN